MAMKSLPIVLLLVATALAVPVPQDLEARPAVEEVKCSDSRFKTNNIYKYKYEAFSVTNVEGTSEKGTGLRYRCDVEIKVPEPCKYVLNVDSCALRHLDDIDMQTKLGRHEKSKDFQTAMSMYDVIVHADNGIIRKVLAHPNEPKHILNMKKGILNMVSLNFVPEDSEDVTEIVAEDRTCLSGDCPATRHVLARIDGLETKLEVTKDLGKCERRPISGLTSSPLDYIWNVTITDKFITSTQKCSFELERDLINRVKCNESHVFLPFSYDGTRGVMTKVYQDLKLSEKEKENTITVGDEENRYVTDLRMEQVEEEKVKVNDPTYATNILKRLVKGAIEEIQMDTPQLFSQFVGVIRTLNNESIHELYERSINCPLYYESCENNPVKVDLIKTFLHDGLAQCGTVECFRVLNTAIIEGEISKPLADFIMYTMALRDYPSLTLIEETLRVAFYKRSQSTFLPLSIMINNHWNKNTALRSERSLPDEIYNAIAFFSSIIGHDCSMPSNVIDGEGVEYQHQVYLALKAIGNIGQPTLLYDNSHYNTNEQIANRLVRCAENHQVPRNISLAAVQAMRRFEIHDLLREPLKRILLKTDNDVELRLASYLMIMGSKPDATDVDQILRMLSDEPITQVRAFIYSHLDNILESESQSVQSLKSTVMGALQDQDLPDYPRDMRRFSRNIELSKVVNISQFDGIVSYLAKTFDNTLFNDTIGQLLNMNKTIGGSIESNFIHNPETYWMRAAMLKTTMNLLGKNWTMFETGIDMQGFEPTLEAIFGPQGFFPDDIFTSIFKTMDEKVIQLLRSMYDQVEPHVMDVVNAPLNEIPAVLTEKAKSTSDYMYNKYNSATTKQKRSTTDYIQQRIDELTSLLPTNIHENIQTLHDEVSKMPLSPAASIYLRLLDNEVGFVTLQDVVNMIPQVNLTKDGLKQMATMMLQKVQNGIEYNITKSYVFMEKEFVLPSLIGLPIRCNLNGTVSMGLRLRGKAGMQLPKIFVAGRIAPSGSVNMISSMATEMPHFTSHAVVANATVYHASRLEGNITIDGPHIKVNLNNTTPINLFSFSTNFYLQNTTGDMHYVPGVLEDRVENVKCLSGLANMDALGLDLCTSYAYPNASYTEGAPRFPLTGPSSFNVTLVNLDHALKTFTLEAFYKQVKPTTSKTNIMMRRRRSAVKPTVDIIDTVVLKFSAPGEIMTREIISMASFDRSKNEFRYNFSIPEAKVTFFSGILNVTCPKTKASGYQLVTNFTAGPAYNASISLTLKNQTTVERRNYTIVYNMSVMDLYSSAVAQYVHDSTFFIASANVTYHWDSETALWRQLAFPFTGYRIDPKNYRQDYIMLKSEKRESFKGVERDSIMKISVLNQNFTGKSYIVNDDAFSNNDITMDLEHSLLQDKLRILNVTIKSEKRENEQTVKVFASRFGHGVVVKYDGKYSNGENNHTLTYGYEGIKTEIMESFKVFMNQPSVMAWFGDSAYSTKRITYNVSHTLCIRDESVPDNKWQQLVYLNTSFPKPLTSERLNFSISARVADESMRSCNNYSYWAQLFTSVPFLWFHNAKTIQLVNGSSGIDFRFNDTTTELFTNRAVTVDDRFNYLWKTMNATMDFKVISPVYNYTLNTTMYNSTTGGYVFDYSSVQNNTMLHLFNMTHGGYFKVVPKHISLVGAFWHPWLQANMTNVLHKHGPIQDFSIANIQAITTDIKQKTKDMDVEGVRMIASGLFDKLMQSSFDLTNLIIVKTPWMANFTLDHVTHFNFSMIDHSMNFELVRPRSNVGVFVNNYVILNREADEGTLAVDVINSQKFVSPIGNMIVKGTYNINNMSRPWRFNNIDGSLGYNISTPIVNSTMNSFFVMDNFTNLMRFDGINAALNHNISSRFVKWNANGSFIIDEFRNLVNYNRINGSLVTDFRSYIANISHEVAMDVKNMSGVFKFEKIGGNVTQKIDSILGKSDFNTGIDFNDVNSLFQFTKVNGSINYDMTSRFVNLTLINLMELKEFTKLWKFGKINGTMLWLLKTSLANATLKHKVDFDNVISPINFNRVNVTLEHEINSKFVDANLKQAYGVYGMNSYLTFDRASSNIKGEIKTPFINGSIAHEMEVQEMEGPFVMKFAKVSLHSLVNCSLLNVTTTNGMKWNNMLGLFTFDRISGSHILNVRTPIAKFNTFGELVFNDFISLTTFRMVNATGMINTNSQFLNFTSQVGHEMHNFRSLFDFDRMQSNERTTVASYLMNHTGETHLTFDNFRSLFNFDSISGNLVAKTRTILGNTNQTYTFDFRNSRELFNFERLFGNGNIVTESRWFNMTVDNNMDLNNVNNLFSFTSMNLFSNIDIKTPIASTIHELRLDDTDHRQLFYFNRIFGTHKWELTTPITSFTTNSDLELLHFFNMFKFSQAHANNNMVFGSRVANYTSNHKYHMDNFRSMFDFDRIVTGGITSLSTIFGEHTSNIDINYSNSRSIWDFDRINSLVESYYVSRFLNNSVVLGTEISDHRDLFNFDRFVGNANMLLNTISYNMTSDAGFGIHNVRKLFNFDRITTNGSINVRTPIISTGSMAGIELNDFRSIIDFSRINATAQMNIASRWLNVTTEGTHGLYNMRNMFVFDHMSTTGKINVNTPIIRSNTLVGLEMHNFTKLWCFTRVNGTATMDVNSRLFNTSNQGMFGIHNVITPWNFERINGSTKMNLITPIVNASSMARVEFNNFINLFNFRRINGTGNVNVSSRWLNMATEGEFGLHNFRKIFTFEHINGSARIDLITPIFKQSSVGRLEFNNFVSLFNFNRINGTGLTNINSKWLNMTTSGEVGLHNFAKIFTFEHINGSARMTLTTPIFKQSSVGRLEFNNFVNLFNFNRINGTGLTNINSKWLNMTTSGEVGLHNFAKIFTFEHINGSARMTLTTPFFIQSSMGGVEFNNFNSLFNFSRVNGTGSMKLVGPYLNASSQGNFGLHNFRQMFVFERIDSSVKLDVSSPIVNFSTSGAIGLNNFTGMTDYSLVNGTHKINFTSRLLNFTTINMFEDKHRTGVFWVERFNISSLLTMRSLWHNFSHNGILEINNCRGILNFERAQVNTTTNFLTKLINMTSNSSVELHGFHSLFNFTKANGTYIVNVSTPIASTSLNASLLLDSITSWRHHRGINGSVLFLFNSPMLNSSVLSQMNMTNFTTFSQLFQITNTVRMMELEAGMIFTQNINNGLALLNMTVPQLNGSVCAMAELNPLGDVLNMSIFRQTNKNVNITDLNWILMLNSSDVVYSNFTWNPETLRAIQLLSGEMLNKTVSVTMHALNKTMTTVNQTLAVTRRIINATINAVNYTYNHPLDSLKVVIDGSLVHATVVTLDATKMFLNQTLNSTIFYTKQTWQLMNFNNVNTTIESFIEAIKQTPLNVPIQFINVTVRSIDFTSINSTVDSILREINYLEVNRTVMMLSMYINKTIEIASNTLTKSIIFINATTTNTIIFVNQKLNEIIVFLTETWREGNFGTMNATIDTIISALNRTRLNTTIFLINNTWQQMDFTSLNTTVESLKQLVNFSSINATIESILRKINVTNLNFSSINTTIESILRKINVTNLKANMNKVLNMVNLTQLNETLVNYTNMVIPKVLSIAKNESHPINQLIIKYFNTTAYNVTVKYYFIVYSFATKQVELVYPIVRNFSLHYYNLAQNLSTKYYPVVYNFTIAYYPYVANYSLVISDYTRNMAVQALDLTRIYSEVLYNHSLVIYDMASNYTMKAYTRTANYSLTAFRKTRNYTMWLVNYTRPQRELLINYTINMTNTALNKAVIYTLNAIEYTADKTEWAKQHHREYIIYYLEGMTDSSKRAEEFLEKAVNYTITKRNLIAIYLKNISQDETHILNKLPMIYTNQTIYALSHQFVQKIMIDGLAIMLNEDGPLNIYLEKVFQMNSMELSMFFLSKSKEYKGYINDSVSYFASVTRSNITFWTNYTLEHAPMVALNLIGNTTVQADTTVRWLNSTRSQSLDVTLNQAKVFLNETVLDIVDFLNKTLDGSTQMILNMTWTGLNKTIQYANLTLVFVNQTICYVKNITVNVWTFIKEETPLVEMTIDLANKTLNFTMTYLNQTVELTWQYAKKGRNVTLEAIKFLNVLQDTYLSTAVDLTKTYVKWSTDYAKDYARVGLQYVNGTAAGWFIRYYDIYNIPYIMYNVTYTYLNNTPEYLRRLAEFNKRLTIDALNNLGHLEDNSFAVYVSHPLNFTSFRKFPNLTNDQWIVVNNMTMRVGDYARQYAKNYLIENPGVQEKISQLKSKYEELKLKVQELRERIPEYKQQLNDTIQDLYETIPTWDEIEGKARMQIEQLYERIPTWDEIKEISDLIKQEIDDILNQWPETYVDIRSKIISIPSKYIELKYNLTTWIESLKFDIPVECQKLIDNLGSFPAIQKEVEKLCNKIPELRLEAEAKYDEFKRYMEIVNVYIETKMQEICEMRPTECEKIQEYWRIISEIDAPQVTEKLEEIIPATWEEAKTEAREQFEALKIKIENLKGEARMQIEQLYERIPTWDEIKEYPDLIKQEIDDILNQWPETYVDIRSKIISIPSKYIELKYNLTTWIESLKFDIPVECQKLIDNLGSFPAIQKEVEKLCNKIPELRLEAEAKYDEFKRYMEIVNVYIETKMQEICEMRPTECEKIQEYWRIISEIDAPQVTEKLEEIIPATWEEAKTEAREQFEALKIKIENLKGEARMKIEELKVKAEELKIKALEIIEDLKTKAIEIKDLIIQEYPNTVANINNLVTEIKNMMEGTLNALREQLTILFDKYYPSLTKYVDLIIDYLMGLRPVLDKEASAMIFGELGVFTFDQKLYEHPGYRDPSCTYVLARDFVDRNFTLLADQNALTIVLPTCVLKIDENNQVFIDGGRESSELPYQTPEVKVIREGPSVNVATHGISINCHDGYFLCTIKMSSWYHGKTQGLLGTFDREVHNDMRKPDGSIATTVIDFINSYEVTGHTYCKIPPGRNTLSTLTGTCDEPVSAKMQVCENLFMNPTSEFAAAFNTISSGQFFEMCNDLARDCRDVCDVAHAYVSVCRDQGIMIEHSPECDNCGDAINLETRYNLTKIAEKTADFVFVVSETRGMNIGSNIKDYIWSLAQKIDKTLVKQDIVDNRYGLVGFGGDGVHSKAHTHTSNSKVLASLQEFESGIRSLHFNGEFQTDAMEALEWATDYHWRPESSRLIILISETERMELHNSSLTYLDVQDMLDAHSINLNVFSEYESLKKDGIEPVLGINYDMTLLTTKKTSADDLAKIALPKGKYAKMATASRGAMFRLDMLLNSEIDRTVFNAQIAKVFRNTVNKEHEAVSLKMCQCLLGKHQCKSLRF